MTTAISYSNTYVVLEEKESNLGPVLVATFVSGQETSEGALNHFLEGLTVVGERKYQPRILRVAELNAFAEYTVEPTLNVEGKKWEPWRKP